MTGLDTSVGACCGKAGLFHSTHWSVVLAAGDAKVPGGDAALAQLCQDYWYPLYAYLRRANYKPEDAKDFVQGFFARMLEKNYLKKADPGRGRFRSFLLLMLKRYLANERAWAGRQKRGAGAVLLSLDDKDAEARYARGAAEECTPETIFERRWATTLLSKVLQRLEADYSSAGRLEMFKALQPFLTGEDPEASYSLRAQQLDMTEGALRLQVHRLRQRYREMLRTEIAHTVATPEEIDDEIRYLFASMAG